MERAAIVCCVESGPLEWQAVTLFASIRLFGGSLCTLPIIAVRPRLGPRLSQSTHKAFHELGVVLIENSFNSRFSWQHYTNKVAALVLAERRLHAEQYIWMDSDIIVCSEPTDLLLEENEDFAACPSDKGGVGSTGRSDIRDETWQRVCKCFDIDADSLPWVTTCSEGKRIRFYMNSGVFAYRQRTLLAQAYMHDCLRYLESKVSRSHQEVHFMDQIVLGLSVYRLGLRWRLLPHSCNYGCYSKLTDRVSPTELKSAKIVHYHDMMEDDKWPILQKLLLEADHPSRAYFQSVAPLRDPSDRFAKNVREMFRIYRGVKRRLYYRSCGFRR